MTTRVEKRHMDRVAKYPCVVCGAYGVQLHHPRAAAGMGQRAPHALVLPLCPECHTGGHGIHGDRARWKQNRMDEWRALAQVIIWMERES